MDVKFGKTDVGLSLSGYRGESHPYWSNRIPVSCYQGISARGSVCGGKKRGVAMCSFAEGSFTYDRQPPGQPTCSEVAGCINVGSSVDIGEFSFDIFTKTKCLIKGYATDGSKPGCSRHFGALSLGVSVGCSWCGAQVTGTLYLKFWFPATGCNEYHFDPYFQLDVLFPCAFGACVHQYSGAVHFLGDPGQRI